jgi:hypothetical protein
MGALRRSHAAGVGDPRVVACVCRSTGCRGPGRGQPAHRGRGRRAADASGSGLRPCRPRGPGPSSCSDRGRHGAAHRGTADGQRCLLPTRRGRNADARRSFGTAVTVRRPCARRRAPAPRPPRHDGPRRGSATPPDTGLRNPAPRSHAVQRRGGAVARPSTLTSSPTSRPPGGERRGRVVVASQLPQSRH